MNTDIIEKKKLYSRLPKVIIYITFVILFFVFLVLSSDILSLVISNSVKKSNVDLGVFKKDNVIYCFDSIEFYDDFLGNVYFTGWAFCETQIDNDEKEIWFIFNSDIAIYMFKNEAVPSNIDKVLGDKYRIQGNKHRFYSTVSTVVMRNGIYKLYIYCKENEENYGLVDTGVMLKKDSNGISQYVWHSSACNVSETTNDGNVRYVIDSVTLTDEGSLQIIGWAFVEGLDSADQTVYVRLTYDDGTKATYDTQSIIRPDVGVAHKSNLYNNSGFKALIPASELNDGNIEIEILVKNKENIYLAKNTYKYPNDKSEGKAVSVEDVSKEEYINTESIARDDRVKYYIDSCSIDKYLVLNGWAFINEIESSKTKVYIEVTTDDGKTSVYTTTKVSRHDVAKAFNSELYERSGFEAVIPLDAISEGDNIITVIADHGTMLKAPTPYTFSYKAEGDD